MRLLTFITEKIGDTSLTTVSHEIATAIFLINPNASLVTGEDIGSYILGDRPRIKAAITTENREIAPLDVNQVTKLPQMRHLTSDVILDKGTIKDAKSLADGIRKVIGPPKGGSSVYWTGPTNDSSKYGSADITYVTSKGIQPVSLKKGHGQLKNLGLASLSSTLLKNIIPKDGDFSSIIYSKGYANLWNQLTRDWISLLIQVLKKNKREDLADILLKQSSLSYDEFQKMKLSPEEIELFNQSGLLPKVLTNTLFLKDVLGYLYTKNSVDGWNELKSQVFNSIFKRFFNNKEDVLNQNILEVFAQQVSSGDQDMWYAAEGGKKILFIPNHQTFVRTSDGLEFGYESNSTGAGYIITIYIQAKQSDKNLAVIDITLRWGQGQMIGSVTSKSNLRKVNIEKWNNIFRV